MRLVRCLVILLAAALAAPSVADARRSRGAGTAKVRHREAKRKIVKKVRKKAKKVRKRKYVARKVHRRARRRHSRRRREPPAQVAAVAPAPAPPGPAAPRPDPPSEISAEDRLESIQERLAGLDTAVAQAQRRMDALKARVLSRQAPEGEGAAPTGAGPAAL